jgi:hypothetical protein
MRTVVRNAPLYDGTPRREIGYRAFVQFPFQYPKDECDVEPWKRHIRSRVYKSPLFKAEYDAYDWQPNVMGN